MNLPDNVKEAMDGRECDPANMTIRQIIAEYTAWYIGDDAWGRDIYDIIKKLEKDGLK